MTTPGIGPASSGAGSPIDLSTRPIQAPAIKTFEDHKPELFQKGLEP